jgi:ATP synthase protein I
MTEKKELTRQVEKAADELARSRREKGFWHYTAILGVGGWLFVLPVVAGAYLGRFIDRRVHDGISWTVTFIILGLALGIYNVWYYYTRRLGR